MSLNPSDPDRFGESLEQTRRNVRKLEIEAYRIRHDLTRLEAEVALGLTDGEAYRSGFSYSTPSPGDSFEPQTTNPIVANSFINDHELNELAVRTDAALIAARQIDDPCVSSPASNTVAEGVVQPQFETEAEEPATPDITESIDSEKSTGALITPAKPSKRQRGRGKARRPADRCEPGRAQPAAVLDHVDLRDDHRS
jgi:hypothetical protein